MGPARLQNRRLAARDDRRAAPLTRGKAAKMAKAATVSDTRMHEFAGVRSLRLVDLDLRAVLPLLPRDGEVQLACGGQKQARPRPLHRRNLLHQFEVVRVGHFDDSKEAFAAGCVDAL